MVCKLAYPHSVFELSPVPILAWSGVGCLDFCMCSVLFIAIQVSGKLFCRKIGPPICSADLLVFPCRFGWGEVPMVL